MNFWDANGFWFAIGIMVGLAIEFGGRFFFEWWYGPRLRVDFAGVWPVRTTATIPSTSGYRPMGQAGPPLQEVNVTAYRFRVRNDGRRAATNVGGTLEFEQMERRVRWYEGDGPHIVINAHDWTFLDVYGVVLDASENQTRDIVMPTERDWNNLPTRTLNSPLMVKIRVTAENARPSYLRFLIDHIQDGIPVLAQ